METRDNEVVETTSLINEQLRKGGEIFEVIDHIQSLPRPIVVDFNNVLANNSEPLVVNPAAKEFIDKLLSIGTVIIVTTARDWEPNRKFLADNGLWNDHMVLINRDPLADITLSSFPLNPETEKLVGKQVSILKGLGKKVEPEEFKGASATKRISHVFGKSYNVPIVDDGYMAVIDNPGMFGVWVEKWNPEDSDRSEVDGVKRYSLKDAAKIVEDYYKKIT